MVGRPQARRDAGASGSARWRRGPGSGGVGCAPLRPEDAILLPEIVDAIFLVASHPASQGQHEEVQSVGHGRRLPGSDTTVTHVVSGFTRLDRFLAPYGGTFSPRKVQGILVIVRTWLYQAALDPVVAEEASLSRPLSPAQAPRKCREWILVARRPEEPDRVAGGRDTRIPIRGRSAADERLRNGRVAGTPRRAGPSSIGRSSRSGVPAVLRRAASASARRLGPPRGHVCCDHGPVRPCGLGATSVHRRAVSGPRPAPLDAVVRRTRRRGAAVRGAAAPAAWSSRPERPGRHDPRVVAWKRPSPVPEGG